MDSKLEYQDKYHLDERVVPCRCCGLTIKRVETLYHKFGLCSLCAEIAANLYSDAHSGQYLTWGIRKVGPEGVYLQIGSSRS